MTEIRPIKVVHFTHGMNSTEKNIWGGGNLKQTIAFYTSTK